MLFIEIVFFHFVTTPCNNYVNRIFLQYSVNFVIINLIAYTF
nr:MAG TPA: hypothetical protein [Caudoviricetes sp.]